MKKHTSYICEICQQGYPTEKLALKCEAQGVKPSRHKVGDTVYVALRYHSHKGRPFAKRVVTDIYPNGHETAIVLDEIVQMGKDCYIGADNRGMGALNKDEGIYPARDSHLHLFGEKVVVWTNLLKDKSVTVSEETVDPDE